MHFKSWTLAALAAGVSAQLPTDSAGASVIQVLATAIPADSISMALADPTAFASQVASSLSAGNTPKWYQALPSDVKSYLPKLYPIASSAASSIVATEASTTPAASTPQSSSAATTASAGTISSTAVNSTSIQTVSSATLASTGGANSGSASGTGTGAVSTGGASYPTAVVGAGVAGALGFLGMLAL